MTPYDLRTALENCYGRKYPPGMAAALEKKMERFTGEDLDLLYDKIIESSTYLPRVAALFDLALDYGMMQPHIGPKFDDHDFSVKTNCRLCRGQGAIAVFCEAVPAGDGWGRRNTATLPLKSLEMMDYERAHPREYVTIARCSCLQGDSDTLPKGWPKWGEVERQRRERPRREFRQAAEYTRKDWQ